MVRCRSIKGTAAILRRLLNHSDCNGPRVPGDWPYRFDASRQVSPFETLPEGDSVRSVLAIAMAAVFLDMDPASGVSDATNDVCTRR
jgi:hypothetical protein